MMTRYLISSVTLLFGILLVGCGAPSKSYYLLTPAGPLPAGGGRGIGVGPVSLPAYLNRPNLVFKQSSNLLAVSESHRWAGDLEDNISSVLAINLGRRLGTGNVRTYPWASDKELRYQISVDIRQLHGTAEGDAYLEASWRVYSLPSRAMVTSRSWSGTEPLKKDGYEELAAAESRLLDRLSAQISKGL